MPSMVVIKLNKVLNDNRKKCDKNINTELIRKKKQLKVTNNQLKATFKTG